MTTIVFQKMPTARLTATTSEKKNRTWPTTATSSLSSCRVRIEQLRLKWCVTIISSVTSSEAIFQNTKEKLKISDNLLYFLWTFGNKILILQPEICYLGVYCGSPILQKEIKAAKDTLNQIINNAEYVNDFITLDPAQGTALDCKVKT